MAGEGKQATGDAWGEEGDSKRPAPDGFDSWPEYWKAQGMPWRTEPQIDEEREGYLAQRRAVKASLEQGIYPFRDETGGIRLSRADIEWLLATHTSGGMVGPINEDDASQWLRAGLDLRGANLIASDLRSLPLAGLRGGLAGDDWRSASDEQRIDAGIHLEEANVTYARLQRSLLNHARFDGLTFAKRTLKAPNSLEHISRPPEWSPTCAWFILMRKRCLRMPLWLTGSTLDFACLMSTGMAQV